MERWFRSRWARGLAYRIPMVLTGVVVGVALAFVFGLLVMALWNWVMPTIFGLPLITYWQGWALVVLAHILFKAGSGSGSDSGSKKVRREVSRGVRDEVEKTIRHEVTEAISREMAAHRSDPGPDAEAAPERE
jgi:hypothetical protein